MRLNSEIFKVLNSEVFGHQKLVIFWDLYIHKKSGQGGARTLELRMITNIDSHYHHYSNRTFNIPFCEQL